MGEVAELHRVLLAQAAMQRPLDGGLQVREQHAEHLRQAESAPQQPRPQLFAGILAQLPVVGEASRKLGAAAARYNVVIVCRKTAVHYHFPV